MKFCCWIDCFVVFLFAGITTAFAGNGDSLHHKDALRVLDSAAAGRLPADTAGKTVVTRAVSEPDFVNVFIYDLFTTANAIHVENAQTADQKNEFNFYYNITLNNTFKAGKFALRSYLYNEYGLRHFPDSITVKGADNYMIRNTLQLTLKKRLRLQVGVSVKSQLWKTYGYRRIDSIGYTEKYLYADYFSPGYIAYSLGMTAGFFGSVVLDVGLVGGKITKIKNQQIYDQRYTDKLYGLPKGNHKTVSYGLSVMLNTPPKSLTKNFWWECNANMYLPKEQIGRLKGCTLDAMNVFHYIFFQNMRVSLRTQVKYDEDINKKVFMLNTFSIGFYLTNKL